MRNIESSFAVINGKPLGSGVRTQVITKHMAKPYLHPVPCREVTPPSCLPTKNAPVRESWVRLVLPQQHSSSLHPAHTAPNSGLPVAGTGNGLWESQEPSLCSLRFFPVLHGNVLFLLQENTFLEEKEHTSPLYFVL